MIRLALLFFLSRLHPSATDSGENFLINLNSYFSSSSTDFQLVYGHALAQKLTDNADDAETAVQVYYYAYACTQLWIECCIFIVDLFISTRVITACAVCEESTANSHKHGHSET